MEDVIEVQVAMIRLANMHRPRVRKKVIIRYLTGAQYLMDRSMESIRYAYNDKAPPQLP